MATRSAKVRVAVVAARQWGRISRAQLRTLGVASSTVAGWLREGYLHRLLPRVYAIGHPGQSIEGDLAAALLYAGPGAALSHATAAWWWGLADHQPAISDVSSPRRCGSLPGIHVHQRRCVEPVRRRGLPVTSVAQTLMDYAAKASWPRLRRALANADYRNLLDLESLDDQLRRGRKGAARLRKALEQHRPELARTRSDLEVAFFELCEQAHLPLPQINVRLHGWTVDFYRPDRGLVVEVDGYGNHRSPAQVRRDRKMDLVLRSRGLIVRRYSDEQVTLQAVAVVAELRAAQVPAENL